MDILTRRQEVGGRLKNPGVETSVSNFTGLKSLLQPMEESFSLYDFATRIMILEIGHSVKK